MHSKLTGFPIAVYSLAVGLDAVSMIGGGDRRWSRELWRVGTYLFVAGAVVSVLAALTSLWHAWKSSEAGTQARRSTNIHATITIGVTVLTLVAVVWRLYGYHTEPATPVEIMMLSVVIAWLVSLEGTFGGNPVHDFTFNVDSAPDLPSGAIPRRAGSHASTPTPKSHPETSGVPASWIADDTTGRPSLPKGWT